MTRSPMDNALHRYQLEVGLILSVRDTEHMLTKPEGQMFAVEGLSQTQLPSLTVSALGGRHDGLSLKTDVLPERMQA
jgi:hypothetical protein